MAREQRKDVDYFPHPCGHGRKMSIIQGKYGNDGYRIGFINRYGAEKLKEIDDMAQKEKQKTHKWERQDLEDIRSVFQEKLKLLTIKHNSNE